MGRHTSNTALCELYAELVIQVYKDAQKRIAEPAVLDLGAGEGSATLPFLELGARVTAVDISSSQLESLRTKCARFGDRLQVRCADVNEAIKTECEKYDVVVANSFLHHVPDYLGLIAETLALLNPGGQFFSFQDPLRTTHWEPSRPGTTTSPIFLGEFLREMLSEVCGVVGGGAVASIWKIPFPITRNTTSCAMVSIKTPFVRSFKAINSTAGLFDTIALKMLFFRRSVQV